MEETQELVFKINCSESNEERYEANKGTGANLRMVLGTLRA